MRAEKKGAIFFFKKNRKKFAPFLMGRIEGREGPDFPAP